MEIIRNEKKIKRYRQISQLASILGLSVLAFGLYLSFQNDTSLYTIQMGSLLLGILLWQVSLNYSYRFARSPRPDEILDGGFKKPPYKAQMYHYVLPASHVLLTRSGPIVLLPKSQTGKITVSGENGDRWRRRGSFWSRFSGQEPPIGSPTLEAEHGIGQVVKFIRDNAPELEDVRVGAIIVFTADESKLELEIEESRMPISHISVLKKYVGKQLSRPLPPEQYKRLRAVFNEKAEELGALDDE